MVDILSGLSVHPPDEVNQVGRGFRIENLNVSRVLSRLGWDMDDAVPANYIAAPEIPGRQLQANLWPSRDIIHLKNAFEGEVPHEPVISLHGFVGVLGDSSLDTGMNLPVLAPSQIVFHANSVAIGDLP